MATSKLTIDLTERNRDILERIKATQRSPYGNTINTLIEIFCNVPESVKKELIGFIKPQLKEYLHELPHQKKFPDQASPKALKGISDGRLKIQVKTQLNLELKLKQIHVTESFLVLNIVPLRGFY